MERRGFLLRLGLLGTGPLAIRPGPLLGAPAVPEGQFRLERMLRRDLFDGQTITVDRSWLVRFDASADSGLTVSGEQLSSTVEAPPALAELARLEEQRTADGLLPLRLSAVGMILDPPGTRSLDPLSGTVIEAAADYVADHSLAPKVELNVREFVAMLSRRQMGWLSHLPRDLFFPVPRSKTARRDIALPDGGQGRVDLRENARADAASGLLESFMREAITTIGDSSRSAAETWQLGLVVS